MSINTKKLTGGFTIIEVLIVLAIAGLILAIVFLAVPALQRNSRNQSIRSDAASILAGVNDFIANNQGQLPSGATPIVCNNGTVSITGTNAVASEAKVRGGTTCSSRTSINNQLGDVSIGIGYKCTVVNGIPAFLQANRAVAAGFMIENTSGANSPQCIES